MFDIKGITIYEACKYRKNLEAGVYPLGETQLKDFFGKNVTLHTLVGKNGSGKSSLLDIVFRMVNNVGAVMCRQEARDASARVRFVRHIYADLEYVKSFPGHRPMVHHCKLCCRDTSLWIEYDDSIYWLGDVNLWGAGKDAHEYYFRLSNQYGKNKFHELKDLRPLKNKQLLGRLLFYTVATNYSMLGFQAIDYADEESLEWDDSIYLIDSDGSRLADSDGALLTVADWIDQKGWIKGIFHKNDGYMCPIVLNPFRDGGTINMDTESALTVSRLAALLISEDMDQRPIIDDYFLDHIQYERKKDFYLKFKPVYGVKSKNNEERNNMLANGGDVKLFTIASDRKGTVSWVVLNELRCPMEDGLGDAEIYARMYVVYKILNIAATYPFYEEYKACGDINRVFSVATKGYGGRKKLLQLVQLIISRDTHIEQKVHQVLRFIRRIGKAREQNHNYDSSWLDKGFSFDEYRAHLGLPNQFDSIEDCLKSLPPNIFLQTIYLKEKVGDEWRRSIPFVKMSSGQKQMLYQLSTLMYHLLNLKSVPVSQVKYYHVNIVLDEIEVCFHPEYQRMFIARMLELLVERLHLNEAFGIHIWLTTHSPFILSDIPAELISYMESGHMLIKEELEAKKIRPPMAGNISELLHQSFFLYEGFIGEYARKKILSLVDFLTKGEQSNDNWDMQQAKLFIDGISEPFINKQLSLLYSTRFQ